ncbi:MAG: Glucanase [Nocardioides sp.]|nr:Glucanase [Nocardioides sp.]
MRLSLSAAATCLVLGLTACGGEPPSEPAERTATRTSATVPMAAPTTPPVLASPAPSETAALSDLQAKAQQQAGAQRRRSADLRRRLERQREQMTAARAAANPLAGRRMGVYQGPQELAWEPYARSRGATRATLAEIALRPKARWFGSWIADRDIYAKTRDYVRVSQDGDPKALVQMAMFRMVPWEHEACDRLPTAREQASYKRWTDEFARGIGRAHAAVVLQPDGPFALCAPRGSTLPSKLIAYAARTLAALPHTSVYIDGGAGDWPSANGQGGAAAAADFLVRAGVADVRGVALNSTHYSPTEAEVRRGAEIVEELARRGIPGKKVVINTSSNGQGFGFGTYTGPDPDNAYPCRSKDDPRTCVALGIPPTTSVGAARWGLPDDVRRLAVEHVDAYLWFGRPWLYRQADPFQVKRALAIVRSSPYVG